MISAIKEEMILAEGEFAIRVLDYLDSLEGFDEYSMIREGQEGFLRGIRRDNHRVSYLVGFSHAHKKDIRIDGRVANEDTFMVGGEERRSYRGFSFSRNHFDKFALNGGHPCCYEARKIFRAIYPDDVPSIGAVSSPKSSSTQE